jgi:hypothetical protein
MGIVFRGAGGGSDPADRVATLTRFVRIAFSQGSENRVDAAIAAPVDPPKDHIVWNTKEIGAETPAVIRQLGDEDLGFFVQKTGRTTEHTVGVVQTMRPSGKSTCSEATFVNQIIDKPSRRPFLMVGFRISSMTRRRCVGLLFAGSKRRR